MGTSEKPQKLSRGGGKALLGLLGRKRFWGALILIIIAAIVVPTVAKVPVTLALSITLIGPLLNRSRSLQAAEAAFAGGPVRPGAGARFVGFRGEETSGRIRWRQVRCVVKGADLEMASYWRRGKAPDVVSMANARVTSTRMSAREDRNLKRGQASIIEFALDNGSSLQLAVDAVIAGDVRALLLPSP